MDKVVAAVRCRPITIREQEAGHVPAIQISLETKQVIVSKERAFHFNYAYSEETPQDQVYNELVNPVVDKVMEGFNACVMAYGQTGSGKTFTMGTNANSTTPGIVQKALNKVFANNHDNEIQVSFLEVYKEEVLDLLSPVKKKMQVIDFKPAGLTLVKTLNVESALSMLDKGLRNRHVGATNANLHSSRSHAVFTIHFTKISDDGLCSSKLYLVDLAGSESVSAVSGDTRREGLMINKGLFQLGIVMSALSSAGQDHIPYRNSALTAILKDTLSPQNFIVLIACVSPLNADANMTINSLQFASRVGNMKINPEAGIIIKQRIPVTTPFKVPSSYRKRINTTIATPGSHGKVYRPALRPLNNTIDSPRTPRVKAGKCWPTSTPLQEASKPIFDPTPISKKHSTDKRRSSTDWSPLNISTSTVMDSMTPHIKAQACLAQNPENESWLRSIISDVIREELKSHTFLSQTQQSFLKQEGSSDSKPLRRSARLSKNSFFDHDSEATIVISSSQNLFTSPQKTVPSNNPRRSVRLLKSESMSSPFSQETLDATIISSSPNHLKCDRKPLTNSQAATTTLACPPVRRSTRLSVAPRPIYYTEMSPQPKKPPPQSKKAACFSYRLSLLPQETPENAQRKLNDVVLNVLKSGDVRKLQSLPTIGPKTAAILSTHRQIFGPIESFKDLEKVRGLSKNFTKRFLWANNIVDDDSV